MKVRELIEALSKHDWNADVRVCADTGDPNDKGDLSDSPIREVDDSGPDHFGEDNTAPSVAIWLPWGTYIAKDEELDRLFGSDDGDDD